MSAGGIVLLVEDSRWTKTRGLPALKRAAAAALAQSGLKGKSALTVLLASDRKLHALNRDFRGKDKPTNVLSFPAFANDFFDGRTAGRKTGSPLSLAGAPRYRGDIAIAYGVTAKEAKAAGKTLIDHAAHLVVHGVLHLAGYDHERPRDAKVMEPLEVKILAKLGIADPYGSVGQEKGMAVFRPAARPRKKVTAS